MLKYNSTKHAILVCLVMLVSCQKGQVEMESQVLLDNGVSINEDWPPRYGLNQLGKSMTVPYLKEPIESIPINVGRQLFVDDFLIDTNTLVRNFHSPVAYENNPVIRPDRSWEYTEAGVGYAAPFSDGIWYDEKDQKFKMWYLCGGGQTGDIRGTGYAESSDGKNWIKPIMGIVPNTNLVSLNKRDGNTVWLDRNETDSSRRYKMFNIERGDKKEWRCYLKYSEDGINWRNTDIQSGLIGDRSTIYYNPFRDVWVYSLRQSLYSDGKRNRIRNYLEDPDLETLIESASSIIDHDANSSDVSFWFGAWENEVRHPDFPEIDPGVYNHDAIAYESLFIGFFSIWQGPENNVCDSLGIHKRNEILVGYSRDGFHWDRPVMDRFMGVDDRLNAWNRGNMQSIGGVPIIVGDSLYFYSSGRAPGQDLWDGNMSTGLFMLRRDGFASLSAIGEPGYVTTKNLKFDGNYLFVNADASNGQLLAELLDEKGNVIEGYSKDLCTPLQSNSTSYKIEWNKERDLGELPEKVRVKFYLNNASVYSFWVSEYETAESNGYTAGGGPGLHASGRDLPLK